MYVLHCTVDWLSGMLTHMSDLYLNVPVLIVYGSGVLALTCYLSLRGVIYHDVNRLFVENIWQAESVRECMLRVHTSKLKPS